MTVSQVMWIMSTLQAMSVFRYVPARPNAGHPEPDVVDFHPLRLLSVVLQVPCAALRSAPVLFRPERRPSMEWDSA